MAMRFLLVVTVILLISDADCKAEFYVQKSDDCDISTSCIMESLFKVANFINFSLTPTNISVRGSTETITGYVEFHNVSSITLKGNGVHLMCSNIGGLTFIGVINVNISNLTLYHCGNSDNAALQFINCTNVTVIGVNITQSLGTAMLLKTMTIYGVSVIKYSTFTNNGINDLAQHRGGIYVDLSLANNNLVTFKNCTIKSNSATRVGGGMDVSLHNESSFNSIVIEDCNFTNNSADWGGGLFVQFGGNSANNFVTVIKGIFVENHANRGGGGAGLGHKSNFDQLVNNTIVVNGTSFMGNVAQYGGGTSLYAMHSRKFSNGEPVMSFVNCTWAKNFASFSPSVDVSPYTNNTLTRGFLPTINFDGCIFDNNIVQYRRVLKPLNSAYINTGSFVITGFKVIFSNKVRFSNHHYSALLTISGTVEFDETSDVCFSNNTAVKGGAIAMYGFSVLSVANGSSIQFLNNSATDFGGAIYYHTFDQHDFVSTRGCFIQPTEGNKSSDKPPANFTFNNNQAKSGCSIYTLTLFACVFSEYNVPWDNPVQALRQKASFTFEDNCNRSTIATSGSNFYYKDSKSILKVVPGKVFILPLMLKDELNNSVHHVWRIKLDSTTHIGQDRLYTTKQKLCLYGESGMHGKLTVHQVGFREIAIIVPVKLIQCPPGYYLGTVELDSLEENNSSCLCSSYNDSQKYMGIKRCNSTNIQAYLDGGYWAGYKNDGTTTDGTPESLYTSLCPLEMCRTKTFDPIYNYDVMLPASASIKALQEEICGDKRKGNLCGKCQENLTIYYHSPQFKCGKTGYCRFFMIFYILTEVFPMVVFFTIVIVFDIHFTSGAANGFIFYCQVLDILSINGRGTLKSSPLIDKLSVFYKTVCGLFSLDFFNNDNFSYCLWPDAKIQHVLSFNYVTTAIAFLLVMALVVTMRYCCYNALSKIKRQMSLKESVVHGLTTFLIISYTQCAKVSFQILTPQDIYGQGGKVVRKVTFYGGIDYFGDAHMCHAVLAVIFLMLVVITPPLVLILHRPYLLLLEALGYSEHHTLNLPIIKLKPLLDSFHNCFKPQLWFFASIYLLYRIVFLIVYVTAHNLNIFYMVMEAVIVMMLGVHSLAQPYEKWSHNIVDTLIFVNLASINAIFWMSHSRTAPTTVIRSLEWIRLILVYLPLLVVSFYIVKRITRLNQKKLISNASEIQAIPDISHEDEEEDSFISFEDSYHHDIPYIPAS